MHGARDDSLLLRSKCGLSVEEEQVEEALYDLRVNAHIRLLMAMIDCSRFSMIRTKLALQ